MADTISDKGTAAAQKAYETATAAKSDSQPQVSADGAKPAKADPVAAPKAPEKVPAAKTPAPAKVAQKKPTAAAAKKTVVKKAPAKTATAKSTAKKTTLKKTPTNASGSKRAATPEAKDTTMATKTDTQKIATDMTNEMQTRLAGMYEKGTEMTGEMVTFQRANAEAMTEAGKILFTGMQDLTRGAVEEGRKAADQFSENARLMAAAKSPTELMKLQGDMVRSSFDQVIATGSKNTEAWIKLTNEAFAPLTSRVSETVDKMNKIAA